MAEAQKYPYTTVPSKLRTLLQRAPNMGRPDKVTVAWLKQASFTSSNDPSMIPVLKFIGILQPDGRPSELWDAVRAPSQERRAQLADAIRRAYADLFALYPDAHRKDGEALRNFFRAQTSGGEQVQRLLVQTFQALTEFADFDAEVPEEAITGDGGSRPTAAARQARRERVGTDIPGLTLNVNLQLQLPATSDGDVYEKLFGAMRKHLMGLTESS
jgi:Family of unknown function (DUF5343)